MDDTSRLAAMIDEMFHNSAAETRAETDKEFMEQMVARFVPIARMVQWIGLSAVLSIALAVLNATSMVGGFFPSFGPLLSFGMPVSVLAAGLTVAVAVGVIAGILPAIRATHASVLDGLRRTP